MVVCVCNAIREHQVRDAARSGSATTCQLYAALGCKPKCGQCTAIARSIIDEVRAAA